MRARVLVTLKREVLDPQGEAVRRGLDALGVRGVRSVRVGKMVELELEGTRDEAELQVNDAAKKLLANPVIEDVRVEWPDG